MSDRLKQAEELGELLGGIARCAFRLADESEENAVTGECTSDAHLFRELAKAFDACDYLSEPEEGYVTDGWYRALVKLRQVLMEAQAESYRQVIRGEYGKRAALEAERDEYKASAENWEANADQWRKDWHESRDKFDAVAAYALRLTAAAEQMQRMMDTVFPKVNWGASFIGAEEAAAMNEAPLALSAALASAPAEVLPQETDDDQE